MLDGNPHQIRPDKDGLVVYQEVQRVTRMSPSTIKRRMREGRFPPSIPGLPRPRWERSDIETYLTWAQVKPWNPWQPPS